MEDFEVGERVEWTIVTGGRNQINFTAVQGYIHEIKGDMACCRRGKNGKKNYWVALKALGRPGDRRGTKAIRDVVSVMTGKDFDEAVNCEEKNGQEGSKK